jgi:hypothetical protein
VPTWHPPVLVMSFGRPGASVRRFSVRVAPDLHEGLLDGIFGEIPVTQDAEGHLLEAPVHGPGDVGECHLIAVLCPDDEPSVDAPSGVGHPIVERLHSV